MHLAIGVLLIFMIYFGICVPEWLYCYFNQIVAELGLGGAL